MKPLLAILLVAAVAGCTSPDEEAPDLFGACPQWVAGSAASEQTVQRNGSAEVVVGGDGSVPTHHGGHALDMYLLRLESDAPVQVRAFNQDDRRLEFHMRGGQEVQTALVLELDGTREVQVFLTAVAHGTEPSPSPMRLAFEGAAAVEVHATPFYRVCGVLLDPQGT